jgi:hypothetical protein
MIVISVVAALVCAAFAYSDTSVSRWIAGAIALGMIILAFLFSSLTVIVNDQDVRWYFGPGAWSYSTARSDIESAQAVRNSWTNGWGIRVGSGFRLYNVSGLNAVELKLKSGEIRRIGTDDPTRLAAALQER